MDHISENLLFDGEKCISINLVDCLVLTYKGPIFQERFNSFEPRENLKTYLSEPTKYVYIKCLLNLDQE